MANATKKIAKTFIVTELSISQQQSQLIRTYFHVYLYEFISDLATDFHQLVDKSK